MNFLAHLYLAGNEKGMIIGNFIADHVKGKAIFRYSPEIRFGIQFHRKIDEYTDSHPVFQQSRSRIREKNGKWAGVIIDMFYDHFLSANWSKFSSENIYSFTKKRYDLLFENIDILPERSRKILPHMASTNWLVQYGEMDGLTRALAGMDRRATFDSDMQSAVNPTCKKRPQARYLAKKLQFLTR